MITEGPHVDEATVNALGARLTGDRTPLVEKYSCLRALRATDHPAATQWLGASLLRDKSPLLKHELAYVLGQKLDPAYTRMLVQLLEDAEQHVIVRHEVAAALGAIGTEEALTAVRRLTESPIQELAQTCQVALGLAEWMRAASAEELRAARAAFGTVDAAPPAEAGATVPEMGRTLVDPSQRLFDRYRAMFGLRNAASQAPTAEAALAAVAALIVGLTCPDSALLRHEVAFVLGQLAHPASEAALIGRLSDQSEHGIVRHESADGVCAIGSPECVAALKRFLNDPDQLVSESCVVALGVDEYI